MGNGIAVNIKDIEIVNAVLKAPKAPRELRGFGFDMQFKTTILVPENLVVISTDVTIKDNDTGDNLGQFSAAFYFSVENLQAHVSYGDRKNPELPPELFNTLLGVSVSTMRGLMYGTFKGTFLDNALLPLVDLAKIQPEPALLPN
jgi:hypothetical protein